MNAGYVFTQVKALLDDPEEGFATNAYLQPFLQMAQDDLVADCARDANIGNLKAAVTIPSVPAGTTSLAQEFQAPDGKLCLLSDPIEVREKESGQADDRFISMIPRLVPVMQTPAPLANLSRYYTFTGDDLLLAGARADTDIWVWGSFKPAPIMDANSPLVHDTEVILKYATVKLVALSRGNKDMRDQCEKLQMRQQSAWMRHLYKTQQSIRVQNRPWRPKSRYWYDAGGTGY